MPQVAVVGGGYWGKNLVRNFSDLNALAAICDRRKESIAALSRQYPKAKTLSFTEILGDPSIPAVAIATPAETHGEFIRQAFFAGKDVFVEKPLCLSVEKGEALVKLAKERNRVLMVGHLLWYHPAVLKLKALIDSGELGRIQYIYSNRLNLGKIRREENILWSFAPHDISVILGLLDEMPDQVSAQGGNYLHPQIADVTVSLLSFPSGVKAHIFVSWLHPFKEQKLIVVGDRKMAVFNDMEKEEKLRLYPHSIEWKHHVPVPSKADAQAIACETGEPLRAECRHFLEAVRKRAVPRTDGEEGLRVLNVLQQCQKALSDKADRGLPPVGGTRSYTVHESAFVDDGVFIDEGTAIWHVSHILKGTHIGKRCRVGQNCVIGPNVVIGNNVKIQNNVSVYEGVTLEDHVFCGPSMVFTNVFNPRSEIPRMDQRKATLVKRGATMGANCTILCGITVGSYAFVGAGAVVIKDVPDYALMVGNPARRIGWMCRCGLKLSFNAKAATCSACGLQYLEGEDTIAAK
ncbi:MAG: Gfo/Idh/MocA family oxidoreductase [Nitrospiria bacterium]